MQVKDQRSLPIPDYLDGSCTRLIKALNARPFQEDEMIGSILHLSCCLLQHDCLKLPGRSWIAYYLGIHGYDDKKHHWKHAYNYTPFLSKMLVCIRIIALEYTLPMQSRDLISTEEEPLCRFFEFHHRWLVLSRETPFTALYTMRSYGIKIAKTVPGEVRFRMSADKTICYFEGQAIEIDAWKLMIRAIANDAEETLARYLLYSTSRTIIPPNPYDIIDNEMDGTTGSFFAHNVNDYRRLGRTEVMKNIQDRGLLWTIFDKEIGESNR
jgi:hypothetical protein